MIQGQETGTLQAELLKAGTFSMATNIKAGNYKKWAVNRPFLKKVRFI